MTNLIEEYIAHVRFALSKKRFEHSMAVADMCVKLATVYGEDSQRAYTAGILHDIRKEADIEILLDEVIRSDMGVTDIEKFVDKLLHSISGAYYCKNVLKIEDKEILNAVRYHTVARADMSKLEKIVYLADKVSLDRSYSNVKEYRNLAFDDLDNAMFHTVLFSIKYTLSKFGKIPHYTLEAYNYYNNLRKK